MMPTFDKYRCSCCKSPLVHTQRIERHNLACAERGERSYIHGWTLTTTHTVRDPLVWYDFGKLEVSRT
jgi:hypothetical protein